MPKIAIDAGHGGHDGGAQGNGLSEKELTLKIAKLVQKGLEEYDDAEVVMTREGDKFLELRERAELANRAGAAVFVSIHINAHNDASAHGFETFVYNGGVGSGTIAFQNVVHENIIKNTGFFRDRGKKQANFSVLRNTNMKAVLSESGFISNKSDAQHLKSESDLNKIAEGHVKGVAEFLGLTKSKQPPREENGTEDPQKLYKVQVGAYSNRENAERMAEQLKKDGYPVFITND